MVHGEFIFIFNDKCMVHFGFSVVKKKKPTVYENIENKCLIDLPFIFIQKQLESDNNGITCIIM